MVDKVAIVHQVAVHIGLGMNQDHLCMEHHIEEAAAAAVSMLVEAEIVRPDPLDDRIHPAVVEEVEEIL